MKGTGRLEGDTRLVIPAPVYTCDDGGEPQTLSGPPLAGAAPQPDLRPRCPGRDPDRQLRWRVAAGGRGGLEPGPSVARSSTAWPQTSLEELRRAQALADAGDPAYTWQVDPQLSDLFVDRLREPGAEIAERFLREELGWDKFLFQDVHGERAADGIPGVAYVRCGPGKTNPLYPDAPVDLFGSPIAEPCTPSIDKLRYETVTLDLAQPGLTGPTGIWVVSGWRPTEPFAQADPEIAKAEAQARLEDYLQARIEGKGAEGGVFVRGTVSGDMPLLYATTAGASYERYEIERVSGPTWPDGSMVFNVRLFADGGETVVEQQIQWGGSGFWHDARTTTENVQPMVLPFTYFDGHVTLLAAHPWIMSDPSENAIRRPFGRLIPEGADVRPTIDGGERNDWDTPCRWPTPSWTGRAATQTRIQPTPVAGRDPPGQPRLRGDRSGCGERRGGPGPDDGRQDRHRNDDQDAGLRRWRLLRERAPVSGSRPGRRSH